MIVPRSKSLSPRSANMLRSPTGSTSSSASGELLAQQVDHVARDRPVQSGGRVVEHHLHVPAADADGHEDLLDQADEADAHPASPGSRRSWTISSSRSLARSCVQVDHVELAVLAVGGDHEVDLVGEGVLRLVVLVVVIVRVVVVVIVIVVGVVIVGLGGDVPGALVPLDVEVLVQPGRLSTASSGSNDSISSSLCCDMPLLHNHGPDEPCPSCQTAPRTTTRIRAPRRRSLPFDRGPVHRGSPARRPQADDAAGRADRLADLPPADRGAGDAAGVRGDPGRPRRAGHGADPVGPADGRQAGAAPAAGGADPAGRTRACSRA